MKNKEYEEARNALIPGAVLAADKTVVEYHKRHPSVSGDHVWTREFCAAMDRLSFAAGLISWNPDTVVFGVRRRVSGGAN